MAEQLIASLAVGGSTDAEDTRQLGHLLLSKIDGEDGSLTYVTGKKGVRSPEIDFAANENLAAAWDALKAAVASEVGNMPEQWRIVHLVVNARLMAGHLEYTTGYLVVDLTTGRRWAAGRVEQCLAADAVATAAAAYNTAHNIV